jgi:plasmid stability protein
LKGRVGDGVPPLINPGTRTLQTQVFQQRTIVMRSRSPEGFFVASHAIDVLQSMLNIKSLMNGATILASMTIRNIDDGLKARLRIRAAEHNRSMEDEARDILRTALSVTAAKPQNLAQAIRARLGDSGGVELDIPAREPVRVPPDFS